MLRSLCAVSALVLALSLACSGEHMGPGEVTIAEIPPASVALGVAAQRAAMRGAGASDERQILFGDLHVHTTFSPDAFIMSLPLMGGEGARPPADACDFARFCSGLDFFSINDHAEGITPQHWRDTQDAIRQCNAVSGDPANPDLVAYLGWEWSQVGDAAPEHYGHKNVVLRDLAADKVPRRSIAAPRRGLGKPPMGRMAQIGMSLLDWENRQHYWNFGEYYAELDATPICERGVDTRELPDDCLELAADPPELFEKLDQWGSASIVIPHGNAWGLNTPPGTTWDKQLAPGFNDPARQSLIEVFSGHGNSEEYRSWRSMQRSAAGALVCPEPTTEYEPCCWRAGEIIRSRCEDESSELCASRVEDARANYLVSGAGGFWTVPGATLEDWRGCGQCSDCFLPAFDYRPGTSTQYALAISGFDATSQDAAPEQAPPRRFRFGFIGSSDNHSARPGTGYKQVDRHAMTDIFGVEEPLVSNADGRDPARESLALDPETVPLNRRRHIERQASFYTTSGLVAVHARARDRDSIWNAMQAKQVYGTSGERILLWFDLLDGAGGEAIAPMGSALEVAHAPRFRVRAVGALEQKPGCPEHSVGALEPEALADLCRNECYHPSDTRRAITRIEIVRIRPQERPGEAVDALIEDPWRVFSCSGDPQGCVVEFSDDRYGAESREHAYYARAIQEPTPRINGAGLRCKTDADGRCVEVDPCYADGRTPMSDDCLADVEERAWSSPIFLSPPKAS